MLDEERARLASEGRNLGEMSGTCAEEFADSFAKSVLRSENPAIKNYLGHLQKHAAPGNRLGQLLAEAGEDIGDGGRSLSGIDTVANGLDVLRQGLVVIIPYRIRVGDYVKEAMNPEHDRGTSGYER